MMHDFLIPAALILTAIGPRIVASLLLAEPRTKEAPPASAPIPLALRSQLPMSLQGHGTAHATQA